MNNPTVEMECNEQYREIAELVESLKELLPILEKKMKRLYPYTTQYRLEQEQKQLREECYYCECHVNDKAAPKHTIIPVHYTIVKKSTKQ